MYGRCADFKVVDDEDPTYPLPVLRHIVAFFSREKCVITFLGEEEALLPRKSRACRLHPLTRAVVHLRIGIDFTWKVKKAISLHNWTTARSQGVERSHDPRSDRSA